MANPPAPDYVWLPEAARLAGVRRNQLIANIEAGKLKAVIIDGNLAVRPGDALLSLPKEQQPAYKAVAHLRGKPIGISQAAQKYQVSSANVTRWRQRGLVATLGRDAHHSQRILVDEADVAYCAAIHHERPGRGRWLFEEDGAPRTPKPRA